MPVHYFAYGSNMSQPQMKQRCPGAQFAGRAVLEGWRLVITNRGAANIIRTPNAEVHGVLWRFEPHHIGLMDLWEGVAHRVYRRIWIGVRPASREGTGTQPREPMTVTALTYVCVTHWPGRARPGYIETAMVPGAHAAGIPAAYRDEIRTWLPDRPLGAAQAYRGRRTPKRRR